MRERERDIDLTLLRRVFTLSYQALKDSRTKREREISYSLTLLSSETEETSVSHEAKKKTIES